MIDVISFFGKAIITFFNVTPIRTFDDNIRSTSTTSKNKLITVYAIIKSSYNR